MSLITAAEQQLSLVTQRTQLLEAELTRQVERVKDLKARKDSAADEVRMLEEKLFVARRELVDVTPAHQEESLSLRSHAQEYHRTQLLRKKYKNSLAELNGHCRSFVVVPPYVPLGGTAANKLQKELIVADECTINYPQKNASFIFDGVYFPLASTPSAGGAAIVEQGQTGKRLDDILGLGNAVNDFICGYNISMVAFGPGGSGKSSTLYGASTSATFDAMGSNKASSSVSYLDTDQGRFPVGAGRGVVGDFLTILFGALGGKPNAFDPSEGASARIAMDVSHLHCRISMGLVHSDRYTDLLDETGHTIPIGGSPQQQHHNIDVDGGDFHAQQHVHQDGTSAIRAVAVTTVDEALSLLRMGRIRHDSLISGSSNGNSSRQNNHAGAHPYWASAHSFFIVSLENFNHRGNYRKATAVFADIKGVVSAPADGSHHQPPQRHREEQWLTRSVSSLCAVISAWSQYHNQVRQLKQQTEQDRRNIELKAQSLPNAHTAYGSTVLAATQPNRAASVRPPAVPQESVAQGNGLVRLLRDAIGGNSKTTLITIVGGALGRGHVHYDDSPAQYQQSLEETLGALTYAVHFKAIRNAPVPYDIPAELQKLSVEVGTC